MSQQLVITRGLPASGKTTWAKGWVPAGWALSEKRARVNRDDIRSGVIGSTDGILDYEGEKTVSHLQQSMVRALIKDGYSVVVDDTNLRHRFAQAWANLAQELCVEFKVVDFTDITLDECLKRNAMRDRKVPGDVIRSMHERFLSGNQKLKPVVAKTVDEVREYTPDTDLADAWVFDIDGTLSKMSPDRGPYDWDKVGLDAVNLPVAEIARMVSDSTSFVVVMSGRDGSCRKQTEGWLDRQGIEYDELWMRAAGDSRKDSIVKQELFWNHVAPRFNVLGIFDDRKQVVEMWRAMGLFVAQVDEGNF